MEKEKRFYCNYEGCVYSKAAHLYFQKHQYLKQVSINLFQLKFEKKILLIFISSIMIKSIKKKFILVQFAQKSLQQLPF